MNSRTGPQAVAPRISAPPPPSPIERFPYRSTSHSAQHALPHPRSDPQRPARPRAVLMGPPAGTRIPVVDPALYHRYSSEYDDGHIFIKV